MSSLGESRMPLPSEIQRQAEALRAESAHVREKALRDAERIIGRAGDMAKQIEDQSRVDAQRIHAAAEQEAGRMISSAWQHVDRVVVATEQLVAALGQAQQALEQVKALRASAPLGRPGP